MVFRAILLIDTVDSELGYMDIIYRVSGDQIKEEPTQVEWQNNGRKDSLVFASDKYICNIGGYDKEGNVFSDLEVRSIIDFKQIDASLELKHPRVSPSATFNSEK